MDSQIPKNHEVDSMNENPAPQPSPQPPVYKSKGFWKAAIPGIIVLLCMIKGYWIFLAVISIFAIFGSAVGAIALALGKNSKWKYCLAVLVLSLAICIAGFHFAPEDTKVATDQENSRPSSGSQVKQPASKPVIPADVKTSDLLPDSVVGYTVTQRAAPSASPQKYKGAQEESYLVLQPTTENPYFHSIASADLYVAKFNTNTYTGNQDDMTHGCKGIKTNTKTGAAAGKNAPSQAGQSSSSCFIKHQLGNFLIEATISMKPGSNAASIYKQPMVYAPFSAAYMEKVLRVSPAYIKGYRILAGAYYNLGNNVQARGVAERGLQLSPKNAELYNLRGLAREEQEGPQAAIADYNKSLALAQDAVVYTNRGVAYIECKQYDKALQDLNKSVELDAQSEQAYYWRAIAYKETGKREDAIADCKQALKIEPNYQAARELLTGLQE